MAPKSLPNAVRENQLLTLLSVVGLVGVVAIAGFGAGILGSPNDRDRVQETNRLVVVNGAANVTGNSTVDYVNVTVRRGTRDVNLSTTTIEWLGPRVAKHLVLGHESTVDATSGSTTPGESRSFRLVPLRDSDGSAPVVNDRTDRFRAVINVTAISGRELTAGEEVRLKFITSRRAVTRYTVTIPNSFDGKAAVEV